MPFGEQLKKLRTKKKLSQQELSQHLGINRATYARYETGDNQADYATLQKLADFFEVSIDYLLDYTPRILNTAEKNNILSQKKSNNLTKEEQKYLEMQLDLFRKFKNDEDRK